MKTIEDDVIRGVYEDDDLIISTTQISKVYAVNPTTAVKAALDAVTLDIAENGIYCLLERNGAGKTTLMKLMAGHLATTDGSISIASKPVLARRAI